MAFLNPELALRVKNALSQLTEEVKVKVFTMELECGSCADNRRLLLEVANLSDRIKIEVFDFILNKEELAKKDISFLLALENKDDLSRLYKKANEITYYNNKNRALNAEPFLNIDTLLISSRHLYRMPYSLHEKTALASVAIDKDEIPDFFPKMADPLKVEIKSFIPECEKGGARELLMQAIDWQKKNLKIKRGS